MQAITVRDRHADDAGLSLTELPHPHASENDVIVARRPRDPAAGRRPHAGRGRRPADRRSIPAFAPDRRTPGKTILRVAEVLT
jgi:hypothetical protein